MKPMANTFSQVYVQCVFAVKYRDAIIRKEWRQALLGVIGNLINETGCKTIIVNGVEDHVHCFVGLKPILSISELMKGVKAKSSKYINDHQLVKEGLNGRKDMAFSLMVIRKLIVSLSIFPIKSLTIRNKHSGKSILSFWKSLKYRMMSGIFLPI
jgi:REP element-mobilizing transposase RayT